MGKRDAATGANGATAVAGRAMENSHRAEQGLRLVVELATHRSAGTNVARCDVLSRATGLTSATMDEVLRGLCRASRHHGGTRPGSTVNQWCARGDLNPHVLSNTGT